MYPLPSPLYNHPSNSLPPSAVAQERVSPHHCRANEYERGALLSRYVGFAQELCAVPAFLDGVHAMASENSTVLMLKKHLKLSQPGQALGEADLYQVRRRKRLRRAPRTHRRACTVLTNHPPPTNHTNATTYSTTF